MASRWRSFHCLLGFLAAIPAFARADRVQITSEPPGAKVELNGVAEGVTPFEKDFPGGYFHKTKTSVGSRLGHPLVARISLAGYATKEVTLTEGPMSWVSLKGHNHGDYWLFKTGSFHVELVPLSEAFTGAISAQSASTRIELQQEVSLEELIGVLSDEANGTANAFLAG
jgi:PEGA domain